LIGGLLAQPLSYHRWQNRGMKLNPNRMAHKGRRRTIMVFGDTRLVICLTRKIELFGGSPDNRGFAE